MISCYFISFSLSSLYFSNSPFSDSLLLREVILHRASVAITEEKIRMSDGVKTFWNQHVWVDSRNLNFISKTKVRLRQGRGVRTGTWTSKTKRARRNCWRDRWRDQTAAASRRGASWRSAAAKTNCAGYRPATTTTVLKRKRPEILTITPWRARACPTFTNVSWGNCYITVTTVLWIPAASRWVRTCTRIILSVQTLNSLDLLYEYDRNFYISIKNRWKPVEDRWKCSTSSIKLKVTIADIKPTTYQTWLFLWTVVAPTAITIRSNNKISASWSCTWSRRAWAQKVGPPNSSS